MGSLSRLKQVGYRITSLKEAIMRIFVAIPFPQSVKDVLSTLSQPDKIKAKWEQRDNYHITLRFIGDVDDKGYERYITALKTIQAPAFHMTLQGVGRFPPEQRQTPRVLWVGAAPAPEFMTLYEAVSSTLEANGLPKDKHETYHPHVTLARFKDNPSSEALKEFLEQNATFQIDPLLIDAFVVYQSTLTPQGAIYKEIERFPLQA
jgi:RNA 2',3'-cyclic 3'-phosphodiesterase